MAVKRRPCAKCGRNRDPKFFTSARGRICLSCRRGRVSVATRGARLVETYGITLDEYDVLFAVQGGKCAICKGTRRGSLDIDHDHALAAALVRQGEDPLAAVRRSIRGLLCRRCNRQILRHARDNAGVLRSAADYLDGPPARNHLPPRRTA